MPTTKTPAIDEIALEPTLKIPDNKTEPKFEEDPSYERTVWRTFDLRILPVAATFYFLSFLDRSNIANARVAGMQTDLKMSDYQYSVALTATYVPYIAAELPSNLLLKYVGPDRMLPTMVALWGVVCMMQGFIQDYRGLLICRCFLGLFEGGLFPGLILYLSGFYPRQLLQLRISIFFVASTLSGAFSGLLAAAILKMDGTRGKAGWSWIFIIEGAMTLLFGLSSFLFTPRSPSEARFLSESEQLYVMERLRQDGVAAKDSEEDGFNWVEVARAFKSPHVCFIAVVSFMSGTLLYALAYFEASIVAGLGSYSTIYIQLLTVPPFAVAFLLTLIAALISDTFKARGLTLIVFALLSFVGFTIFYITDSKALKYFSLFFSVSGSYGLVPALLTWNANNTAPHIRRATAVAISVIMTNSGGILSTWLMLGALSGIHDDKYASSTLVFISFALGICVTSAANLMHLRTQNRKKERIRATSERKDEAPGLGDRSAWFIYSL